MLCYISASAQNPYDWYTQKHPSTYVYDKFTDSLVARMTTPPTTAWKRAIDRFVVTARQNNWLYDFDVFAFLNATDSANNINFGSASFNPQNIAGRWASDTGYVGNGSTSMLLTNFNPTTNKNKFTNDSGTIIYYSSSITARTDLEGDYGVFKTYRTIQRWTSAGGGRYYISWGDGDINQYFTPTPKPYGLIAVVKRATETYLYNYYPYKSTYGVITDTVGVNYWAGVNYPIAFAGVNRDGVGVEYSSSRTYQSIGLATVLSQAKIESVYLATDQYLKDVGKLFNDINIVFFGNSMFNNSVCSDTTPSDFYKLLVDTNKYKVYNRGYFGNTDSMLLLRYAADVKTLIHPYRRNIMAYIETINSINDTIPNDSIIARQERLIVMALADGFDEVWICTIPNGGWSFPNFDSLRMAYNTLIKASPYPTGIVDIGADSILGCSACNTNFTYYCDADAEHWKNTANSRAAQLIFNLVK